MSNVVPDLIVCLIVVATFGLVHILSNLFRLSLGGENSDLNLSQLVEQYHSNYGWILRLTINCFGYCCIFIPGYFIYKYAKKTKYLERTDRSCIPAAVRFCFAGADSEHLAPGVKKEQPAGINWKECGRLTYCFVGLMISYLTWGVLQEKIMTKEYINFDKKKVLFRDSQFLVFANRVLAFIIAGIYLIVKRQTRQKVPLFKYSFASFSNIMSAWFQYEALKFVNFPTQVLAKSCKIIPVMLMGKIISKSKYETYEYLTAGLISVGMIFFLTGSTDESKASSVTTLTGVVLLILYMVFDSFTSNWQGDLFKKYSMSPIQMMFGVNLFSTLFTATSLLIQGGFWNSIEFANEHPDFVVDCGVLSISSAIGQLFIFYTISSFGPVVFTIMMTIRQAAAILLSCVIYKHKITFVGMIGVSILFLAIFLRVYCNQRLKHIRRLRESSSSSKPMLKA